MKNKYLDKIGKKDLIEFINLCKSLNIEFDENKFIGIVINTLKYLNGDTDARNELRLMQDLENDWYAKLNNNIVDFSVYDNVYYLADTWVCWKKYSREYINRIKKHINFYDIKTIADLGCGIGYSSVALKQEYNCKVFGTNIKNTNQYKICEKISFENDFILTENIDEIGNVDILFASEYFEHFERPVEHLLECIYKLKPKHILFANTFNAKSIGHFNLYKHFNIDYNGRSISKLFTKTLNENNYKKIITKCWNSRPTYFSLIKTDNNDK
jgi:2-polyprenyl-3-methyl-5-hydroxy-6-metoxy-1,4-benzoquinol methylase